MASLGDIGRWISEHESLLSGMAAMIALVGVTLSVLGMGMRRLLGRRGPTPASAAQPESVSVMSPSVGARSATTGPAPHLPTAPSPDLSPSAAIPTTIEPVLAVLAFDNQSSDPEMEFFSDGVSEEIIQRLARGAKLKVIGRTSSFQFRGERKAEAAQSLQCSHVLDGSIRRSGERVRISAHLVEASSQTTLWSDRYDRGLEDLFAVQDEISESIAEALDRTFSNIFAIK